VTFFLVCRAADLVAFLVGLGSGVVELRSRGYAHREPAGAILGYVVLGMTEETYADWKAVRCG
jgi:hypothetical protein